jgi:probable rRNA maturation factor
MTKRLFPGLASTIAQVELRAFFQDEDAMGESGPGESKPLVEIYLETDSDEEDTAAAQALQELDIEQAARRTLQAVQIEQPVTLTLVISGQSTIQALNTRYRQQESVTDVLSFPLLTRPLVRAPAACLWQLPQGAEMEKGGQPAFVIPDDMATNLGDIVICWPTALQQALANGHPVGYEILFLFCHGLLHLLGYDDQTEEGYSAMVHQQEEILAPFVQKG